MGKTTGTFFWTAIFLHFFPLLARFLLACALVKGVIAVVLAGLHKSTSTELLHGGGADGGGDATATGDAGEGGAGRSMHAFLHFFLHIFLHGLA